MSFILSGNTPKSFQFNGAAVKEIWYGGKKIWPTFIMDEYVITGTLTTKEFWEPVGGGESNCVNWSGRDCDCQGEGYELAAYYKLELVFSAPIKHFPIKYISRSGATVIIEINKFKYDEEKGTYTHDFGTLKSLEELQSVYPVAGVDEYSSIKSCNITEQEYEAPENCNCVDCSDCGRDDCDCAGDMD